jgi:hypothetical protein
MNDRERRAQLEATQAAIRQLELDLAREASDGFVEQRSALEATVEACRRALLEAKALVAPAMARLGEVSQDIAVLVERHRAAEALSSGSWCRPCSMTTGAPGSWRLVSRRGSRWGCCGLVPF